MATVDLTIEQILGAVEQLSQAERERLQREITRMELPLRSAPPQKRMPRRQAKRMSELLLKANSAVLTPDEDAELNALVDVFESLTLANAKLLAQRKDIPGGRSDGHRRSSKR